MRKKVKIILIISTIVIFLILFGYKFNSNNEKYSYEWVEVKDSTIGQYTLYINNSIGKHIDGTARITYLNGESETIEVPKEGIMFVKDIIVNVSNPKKK